MTSNQTPSVVATSVCPAESNGPPSAFPTVEGTPTACSVATLPCTIVEEPAITSSASLVGEIGLALFLAHLIMTDDTDILCLMRKIFRIQVLATRTRLGLLVSVWLSHMAWSSRVTQPSSRILTEKLEMRKRGRKRKRGWQKKMPSVWAGLEKKTDRVRWIEQ
jgi:hypothetical protein